MSWTPTNSGISSNIYTLAIDPTNNQTIYAGTGDGVYKSNNSGSSWSAASSGIPANNSIHSLAINPINSQIIYAGTDIGNYKSINGGLSWTTANMVPVLPILEIAFRTGDKSFGFLLFERFTKYVIGTGLCSGACNNDGFLVLPQY